MDLHPESSPIHFHIQWSAREDMDWECFDTTEAATARAAELSRPGEKFTIQQVVTACQGGAKAR
jgi:hypothetical protein